MNKMYRLRLHQSPCITLFMFKMVDGKIVATEYEWEDITGSASACTIRYDEQDRNGMFTPMIKTSLEVSLIRRDATSFNDIIEADDGEYWAVLTEADYIPSLVEADHLAWDAQYTPFLWEEIRCLFKGSLTLETYGESYVKLAEVRLTFHDKLGELADLKYIPKKPWNTLTNILAELLRTSTASQRLFMEFPFEVIYFREVEGVTEFWDNLKSPKNIVVDVSAFNRVYKMEVLLKLLKSYKMRVYADFSRMIYSPYFSTTVTYLNDVGVLRMEVCADCNLSDSSYFVFTLEKTVVNGIDEYDYINEEDSSGGVIPVSIERRPIIKMDTPPSPIRDYSGNWELVRKAKYIKAVNIFGLKTNLLFPGVFNIEDFDGSSVEGYNLQYRYWFVSFSATAGPIIEDIKKVFSDSRILTPAYANGLDGNGLLGVMVRDDRAVSLIAVITSPSLVIKDSSTVFRVVIDAISDEDTRNVYTLLWVKYEGVFYSYGSTGGAYSWREEDGTYYTGLRSILPNKNEVFNDEFLDIDQPSFIPDGEVYEICISMITGNTPASSGQRSYITGLQLLLGSPMGDYPRKLELITELGETRRKPVEYQSDFYNLPDVFGNSSMYHSGILATGLDKNAGQEGEELNSDNILPIDALVYRGNNGTLLAHSSDMEGVNHIINRWAFEATILEVDVEEEIIIEVITRKAAGVSSSSILQTGGMGIDVWEEVGNLFGMQFRIKGDSAWEETAGSGSLTSSEFFMDINGLLTPDTTYEYRAVIILDSVMYYGNTLEVTTTAVSTKCRIYNRSAITDYRFIAPAGWHVPTEEDWLDLVDTVGGFSYGGGELKEVGTAHWYPPNAAATDMYDFTALPSGRRNEDGTFSEEFQTSYLWSADLIRVWLLWYSSGSIGLLNVGYSFGAAFRLIKDDSTDPGTMEGNDGNTYPTVKIGNQVWMGVNSRETKYRNGDVIPEVTNNLEWEEASYFGAWCYYNNES